MALQAIKYARGSLQLLDQRKIPHEFVYLPVATPHDAWTYIRDMVVRGAPAIGVAGALALAADLVANQASGAAFGSVGQAVAYIRDTLNYLVTSRPTAVNLMDGANKLAGAAGAAAAAPGATPASVVEAVVHAAEAYFEEDLRANRAMGAHGAAALAAEVAARARGGAPPAKINVLTHCNTGSLATSGFGTALGVIRALHERGALGHAYCTETRPYNQGARLTAFELVHDGLPATLVCDSAAAYLMASGKVDAVVVGADRVVATGDTANKIGTYALSLAAAHHRVPFFVAAPVTTLDPALPDGGSIVIEARPAEEITHFRGARVVDERVQVWNPSFDVTPASLITGIITEQGMVPKAGQAFQVPQFVQQHDPARAAALQLGAATAEAAHAAPPAANGHAAAPAPAPVPAASSSAPEAHAASLAAATEAAAAQAAASGFRALDLESVREYVAARPELCRHVGPASTKGAWSAREVGDGNINFVFIVEGPAGGVAIKQSLPYIRCVGESWPLTQDRMRLEGAALADEALHTPQHVPALYLYDPALALVAMQFIRLPAIILRKGLCEGRCYPGLAEAMSTFMACNLFHTSSLALDAKEHRQRIIDFTNPAMSELTEAVIFTEPYINHPNNRHTSPQLDADVEALRSDSAAKAAICDLKRKWHTRTDALLHGDLHTGSIMVDGSGVWVIDPEFAMYGPMAFDVGKLLANLLLMLFATHGHERASAARAQLYVEQRGWLSQCTVETWVGFEHKFLALWDKHAAQAGPANTACPGVLAGKAAVQGPAVLRACQAAFMADLWKDTVAFMGAVIIRRLVGIAHVADMDTIADADVRAGCERRALAFGRGLLVRPSEFGSITDVVAAAVRAAAPAPSM